MAATCADSLDGGSSNDVLFGGLGGDTFIFDAHMTGVDQVYGFDAFDHLKFANFGFSNLSQVNSLMSQAGDDVVFSAQGETVIFHHTQLATLQNSDIFVFV